MFFMVCPRLCTPVKPLCECILDVHMYFKDVVLYIEERDTTPEAKVSLRTTVTL